MSTSDAVALEETLARVDTLVRELEAVADPIARERSRALVQCLLEIHAAGLAHMLDSAADHDGPGSSLVEAWTRDEAVAGLLLLHRLHPVPAPSRVRAALDALEPRLRPRGARTVLLEYSPEGVKLRVEADGGGSDAAALRREIEEAFSAFAPDVPLELDVQVTAPVSSGFVPLAQVVRRVSP